MNKFFLAFKCFFQIFIDKNFAGEVTGLFKKEKVKEISEKEVVHKKEDSKIYGSRILAILQRDGRFIDFLQEKMDDYSDGEIGAVARSLHRGCKKVMDNYITIEPVIREKEGALVTVDKDFKPAMIRVTGSVTGEPPFKGHLRHHGWKVVRMSLPDLPTGQDPCIVEPAEVEVG